MQKRSFHGAGICCDNARMPTILESLESIIRSLHASGARYVVAGGLAVNAHGYTRATHDVDLVVQLSRANVAKATTALSGLDYRPLVPVAMEAFADEATRQRWIDDKGLAVFTLVSPRHPQAPIDLFVTEPFDFHTEFESALLAEIAPDLSARFVRLDTLIEMKRHVGRARDVDDVEHLEIIRRELGRG